MIILSSKLHSLAFLFINQQLKIIFIIIILHIQIHHYFIPLVIIQKIHILPLDTSNEVFKKYVPQYNGYRYRLSKAQSGTLWSFGGSFIEYFEFIQNIFLNTFFLNQFKKLNWFFIFYYSSCTLLFILNYLEYIWKMINIFYYGLYGKYTFSLQMY